MSKYILLWLPMPFLAILNGALRQLLLVKSLGDKAAHQVSVFPLIILLGAYVWVILKKWPIENTQQSIWIGIMWFILTIVFEFTMVLAFMKKPLSEALISYNVLNGELWPLVLLFILVIPFVIYKTQ